MPRRIIRARKDALAKAASGGELTPEERELLAAYRPDGGKADYLPSQGGQKSCQQLSGLTATQLAVGQLGQQLDVAPFCAGGVAGAQARNLSDILPDLLTGAALGTAALVELIRQGAISPRDLAVTTSILIDKAHKLRDLAPEPTTGAADLEREAETVAALAAELRRRGE